MEKRAGFQGGDAAHGADVAAESCDEPRRLSPAAASSSQDGEQTASGALAPEPECGAAAAGRRSGVSPPSARLHFQIPRKNKERKALFQHVTLGSREFEELVKILSSCYRDTTSAGNFSYTKARMVHSELLEKDFIEKRRELKQDGRTDKELSESYCFLMPDPAKLHGVCEKGLSVGHSRISILGNPAMGVYLSKYSDLLQMNPFDPGASGEIIIFKVMKGKVKSIYENISKSVLDPTPKFDCHVSKNAAKVTSLRSYRAFELTQQYFYEYSFDEIKSRPRHVCPYAVVSFLYKGKEGTPPPKPAAPIRTNSSVSDGRKGRGSYTVWSGQLLNGGKAVWHVCLQSNTCPFLPFKLPEKLAIGTVMDLDQVKRKIPAILFSLDTYSGAREVLKSGMYCSLFEVVHKGKHGTSLLGLLHKLERERMVLVNTLLDKGFIFLLSSAQMVSSIDRRVDRTNSLQALFVFQEPRGVSKLLSKRATTPEAPVSGQQEPVMPQLDTFIPALHYALGKVRLNPPADLSAGVQRQMRDYLSGCSSGKVRLYYMNEYQHNLDECDRLRPTPCRGHSKERYLRDYIYGPASYQLAVRQAQEIVESCRHAPEYSPVSDWEGSDGQPADRSNGAHGPQPTSADNDPEKMKELLKLIQLCKRNFEGDGRLVAEGRDAAEDGAWDSRALKRKLEPEAPEGAMKYFRTDFLDNGQHGRAVNSVGVCNTDLRKDETQDSSRPAKIWADATSPSLSESPGDPTWRAEGRGPGCSSREAPELAEGSQYDPLTRLRLPADLQNRPAMEERDRLSQNNPVQEPTRSPEPSSPLAGSEQLHRDRELVGEEPLPWRLVPITDDDVAGARPRPGPNHVSPKGTRNGLPKSVGVGLTDAQEEEEEEEEGEEEEEEEERAECLSPGRKAAFGRLDGILAEEFGEFSTEMCSLLSEEHVHYTCEPPPSTRRLSLGMPAAPFSEYVSDYVLPVPVQSYVSVLCERMSCVVDSEAVQGRVCCSSHTSAPVHVASSGVSPSLAPPAASAPPPEPTLGPSTQPGTLATSPLRRRQHALPQLSREVPPWARKPDLDPLQPTRQEDAAVAGNRGTGRLEPEPSCVSVEPAHGPAPGPNSISSLISQLKPEVFSSLVEIIKDVRKNAVKFYIHSEEESDVCVEIKEYLTRLGNVECNPQSFLENKNNLDKLLIIIQNEDIAAHVHKIPALVSLKKLPSVSFAGVDSLDDVKNHTYNELFISGGFIVSDEFVLNPDFITYEKLQAFLKFLEEQSTPENIWQWKVHCKSQKKLKELGRLNADALSLLNLLATYQKRHLVEFLPYHECDAPSRQAPDLDCLVRLQAQHTQQRHIIFLTERRFEMFPHYSNNGIVISSMDDIMNSFHSLIGFHDGAEDVPTADSPIEPECDTGKEEAKDECVEEVDMSLDSEGESPHVERSGSQAERESAPLQPPVPERLEQLDVDALKTAISHFKASAQGPSSPLDFEVGGASPGAFNVNPHQSFLCPVVLPPPGSNSSGAQTRPTSPYSTSQGQDDSLAASTSPASHLPPTSQVDMTPIPSPAPEVLNLPLPCPSLPCVAGTETTTLCAPLDQGVQGSSAMPGATPVPSGASPTPPAIGQQGPVATPIAGLSYFPIGGVDSNDDWAPLGWSQAGEAGAVGTDRGTPADQEDGLLGPGPPSKPGNGEAGTTNSQGGAALNPAAVQGGGKMSSTSCSQGGLPLLPNASGPRPELCPPVREAPKGSGLLPTPSRLGSINGRGMGSNAGVRGAPPNGPRAPLRHGQEPRGTSCVWRFPHGRGALRPPTMDFTQDPFPWREEYYSQAEGYRAHRNDYNCW